MRTSRRAFLRTTGAAALIGNALAVFGERPRGKAPFRLLYSNDTTNITGCASPFHKKGEAFRPEMLEASVDEVAGTGVDAHLLQPGLGMVPMWPSKVLPLEEHYAWIKRRYGQEPDGFGRYVLGGGDVVKVFIERCRLRGQAPFISFRLNDAHHKEFADPPPGEKAGARLGMSVTRFYAEHPEYRIKPGSLRTADVVQNWAVPEVRAQKFTLIRELCENYDLDGVELDFLRIYSFFRPEETTRERRCAIITDFVKDVRALLDRTARGGRRWLCARVPCYLEALDLLGLDLAALATAGLDMVNASAHYFTTQQHQLAEIRRRVPDAALYFELCHTIWKGEKVTTGYDVFPFRRATREHLHTSAHLAYARGADGISLFNFAYYRQHGQGEGRGVFGEPPFDALKALRDRQALARGPQHWFLAQGWRAPGAKPLPLPRKLESGKTATFNFDLAAPAGGWTGEARLRVQFAAAPGGDGEWRVTWNGESIGATAGVAEPFPLPYPSMLGKPEELRAWRVPARLLREGPNRVEFTLRQGTPATIVFLDLSLD
ncbi:MAG: hypothetical protein AB1705_22535 [Verrucomicrobiota bacterium]